VGSANTQVTKTMDEKILKQALERFDAANAEDPNRELVDGKEVPSALIYGHRMSRTLDWFNPEATDELKLAVRAQHLKRWAIPRSDFPEGIKGYNQWRKAMATYHAEEAGSILRSVGLSDEAVERVQVLVRKEGRTRDADAQQVEDVACLVFLEYYFEPFVDKFNYDDAKLIDIVQKTWRKMSDQAHQAATKLNLPEREAGIVTRALAG